MVLVDTTVWSLSLRRHEVNLSDAQLRLAQLLKELVRHREAQLLGVTRQELLSGIREEVQFRRIRNHLRDFPDVDLDVLDYEDAARISNLCRGSGIAGSAVDMLICAASIRRGWPVLTTDHDFVLYQRAVPSLLLSALP